MEADNTCAAPAGDVQALFGMFKWPEQPRLSIDEIAEITAASWAQGRPDGVIAHQARALGGETFVSFDRRAVAALTSVGVAARVFD
jgi:hypothetical protein